jgi:hypothetical protein
MPDETTDDIAKAYGTGFGSVIGYRHASITVHLFVNSSEDLHASSWGHVVGMVANSAVNGSFTQTTIREQPNVLHIVVNWSAS